jgi:hypothetical protein
MFSSNAPPEHSRAETPTQEASAESYQDQTPLPPAETAPVQAPAPQRVYTTPPRNFQVVSQHDEVAEDAQRPNRRRRHHGSDEAPAPVALQLVETQVEPQPLVVDDALPRRTKPRRRRSSQTESGPLQIVETQSSAGAAGADNPPT